MRIGTRLKEISKLINNKKCVVDVGCDHAFLPIYLVLNSKTLNAIAVDNKMEPLLSAKANIEKYNLESKIKTILSDGLINVDVNSYDALVIAGLGADTIINILSNGDVNKDAELILEANKGNKDLREFLMNNNYEIIDEVMVKDRAYFYTIIKAKYNPTSYNLSEKELFFGPILLKKYPQEFDDYLRFNISILERELERSGSDEIVKKIEVYKGVLR